MKRGVVGSEEKKWSEVKWERQRSLAEEVVHAYKADWATIVFLGQS